jgi:hypothetical protein
VITTHFIGRLLEVRPTEYEDKKTNKVTYQTELTVQFDGITEDGYLKPSIDTIRVDEDDFDTFNDKIGSVIAIPYINDTTQYGQRYYFDKAMPVLIMDKNPLDYTQFKRTPKKEGNK